MPAVTPENSTVTQQHIFYHPVNLQFPIITVLSYGILLFSLIIVVYATLLR